MGNLRNYVRLILYSPFIVLIFIFLFSCNTTEPPSIQPVDIIPMDHNSDWSPKGEWIAYKHVAVDLEKDTSGIYIIRPDGADKHLIIPGGYNPSWSPDGKKIAFAATTYDGQIWIYDLETKIYHKLTNEGFNIDPARSNKGDRIAYKSDQKLVVADTNGIVLLKTNLGGSLPSWSPNDDSICYNDNSILTIVDILNLKSQKFFTIASPDWHPSLDEIVYDFYDYEKKEHNMGIYIFKTNNNQKLKVHGGSPSWSPDGMQIVYTNNIGNKTILYIINRDGSNNKQLTK